MMDQTQTNSRTPFSGEPGNALRPLSTQEPKAGNQRSSPEIEPIENMSLSTMDTHMANAPPGPTPQQQSLSLGNSTGVQQQPKVQTAFIHKLYKYAVFVDCFRGLILVGVLWEKRMN
jgi:hypothetical protein